MQKMDNDLAPTLNLENMEKYAFQNIFKKRNRNKRREKKSILGKFH